MATLGAFTSLYASDRPYRNRTWVLAGIAFLFAMAAGLGVWVQHLPVLAVPLLVVIATIATFVCHAIRIGQPGAYVFGLARAAGTSVLAAHMASYEVGALVLAGERCHGSRIGLPRSFSLAVPKDRRSPPHLARLRVSRERRARRQRIRLVMRPVYYFMMHGRRW